MDKKLINEDITNMKYLFGYKPGKVISEQDIDYTTEEYVDMSEQEEPENDRYMFFSNLEQIHRQMGILLEKDPEMIHSILENGHDWAQDHIATAKESIDQVFDFIMNEENGDDDEDFEMIMNEDLEFDEEETMDSILEKHNLLDEILHKGDNRIMIQDKSSEVVQRLLSILHLLTELKFLSIVNCESADFSDVDICGLPELAFVNLQGTENNFEEQGYECAIKEKLDDDSYSFYYIS
jgi:hypothetical protein